MKNVAALCHCLKSFSEAKLKVYGLIGLTEDILKHHNIDCVLQLLVVILIQGYNARSKKSKEKYKMYNLRRTGASRSRMELSPVF